MRTVWKFTIPLDVMTASFTTLVRIPIGAKLVHVREENSSIAMWYEVDPDARTEPRYFQLFPTGTPDLRVGLEYVGTAIFEGDVGVIHIYEVKDN